MGQNEFTNMDILQSEYENHIAGPSTSNNYLRDSALDKYGNNN